MPFVLSAALAAFLLLPSPHPTGQADPRGLEAPAADPAADPAAAVPVIMRPDASDLFVPAKTRTTAVAILTRNPTLVRGAGPESPYRLSRATGLAWQTVLGSNLPGARAINSVHPISVPEPGSALLLTVSSLLLLRRRRPPRVDLRPFMPARPPHRAT